MKWEMTGMNLQISCRLLKNKIQLDITYYFIMLMLGSTCFGHHYAYVVTNTIVVSSC